MLSGVAFHPSQTKLKTATRHQGYTSNFQTIRGVYI